MLKIQELQSSFSAEQQASNRKLLFVMNHENYLLLNKVLLLENDYGSTQTENEQRLNKFHRVLLKKDVNLMFGFSWKSLLQ